jgi:hypothetical protein
LSESFRGMPASSDCGARFSGRQKRQPETGDSS